ncbi:MAG TPA: VWA domain-containing protein [Thermoanaerobaculia bacterium]|nr:VWA domain-containing protein [Thermoanaerobaculia bacterium]
MHAVAAATPSSEAPTFGEVVDVQLVTVEAVVLDSDGKPIPDLSAADFKLFEDNAPVTLEHVELVDGRAASPAGGVAITSSAAAAEDAPLNLAVFLDEVHVSAGSRIQMLRQMSDVLGKTLRKDDRVMVALYDGSTRVVLPFTSDRKALAEALAKAETVSLARLNAESDWRWMMAQLYEDAAGEHGWSPCLHIQEFVDAYAQEQLQQVGRAIDAFGSFVDSLAGIVGRKAVLHISDGISTRPGSDAALYAQELCSETAAAQGTAEANYFPARTADIFDASHHTTDSSAFDTSPRWEEVAARASTGNVTIYTFQAGRNDAPDMTELTGGGARARGNPKSVHPPQKLTPATIAGQRADLQESLFVVADRSGGRAWLSGVDLARDLRSTVGELQTYYLLTYTPRERGGTEMRHLQVEVTRPGATVRSRKLYRPRTAHQQVADGLLGRLLYGSTKEPSPLGLELVSRRTGDQGKVKARFRLAVPVGLLQLPTAAGTAPPGMFTAFAAVADGDGGTSPVRETQVPVRLGTGADAPKQFVWEVEMLLRPGDHDVGMAVRNELTGETTFVVRHFAVRGR